MIEQMLVRAAPGRTFPRERSRVQIGQTATHVPNTQYYRRAIADGDLMQVAEEE